MSIHFPQLMRILKPVLRKKGITYQDIGEELGLSESAVKKIFAAQDCSLDRLNKICKIAGVPLTELMAEADNREPRAFELSEEQDEYLATNAVARKIYMTIVVESQDFDGLKTRYDEATLVKYLRKMDQLKLLSFLPGNAIKLPFKELTYFKDQGKTVQIIKRQWGPRLLEQIALKSTEENYRYRLNRWNMSETTLKKFILEFEDLQRKYSKLADRDHKFSSELTIPVSYTFGVGPIGLEEYL